MCSLALCVSALRMLPQVDELRLHFPRELADDAPLKVAVAWRRVFRAIPTTVRHLHLDMSQIEGTSVTASEIWGLPYLVPDVSAITSMTLAFAQDDRPEAAVWVRDMLCSFTGLRGLKLSSCRFHADTWHALGDLRAPLHRFEAHFSPDLKCDALVRILANVQSTLQTLRVWDAGHPSHQFHQLGGAAQTVSMHALRELALVDCCDDMLKHLRPLGEKLRRLCWILPVRNPASVAPLVRLLEGHHNLDQVHVQLSWLGKDEREALANPLERLIERGVRVTTNTTQAF